MKTELDVSFGRQRTVWFACLNNALLPQQTLGCNFCSRSFIDTQIRKWDTAVGTVSNIQIFAHTATDADSVHIYFIMYRISRISRGFRINPETVRSSLLQKS